MILSKLRYSGAMFPRHFIRRRMSAMSPTLELQQGSIPPANARPLHQPIAQKPTILQRFSSKYRETVENEDISLLERFQTLALTLKSCVIPTNHPLNAISSNIRCKIASRPPSTEAELLSLLSDLSSELTAPIPIDEKAVALANKKKNSLFGRLRSRMTFKRSAPIPLTAQPVPAFSSSPLVQIEGEAVLQEMLANFYTILSNYGHDSKKNQFVSFDNATFTHTPVAIKRGYELDWQFAAQTCLRISLLKEYLDRLRKAVTDGDISTHKLQSVHTLTCISDSILIGTSSERIVQHLHLYDEDFSVGQLQDAFYVLFEPETAAVQKALLVLHDLHPDHKKSVPKLSQTYLLDRFELNTKSRSMFAWAIPEYKGFSHPLKDAKLHLSTVLKSRAEYFEAGAAVGNAMVHDLTADRRLLYYDRGELRESLRNGAVFIGIIAALDVMIQRL